MSEAAAPIWNEMHRRPTRADGSNADDVLCYQHPTWQKGVTVFCWPGVDYDDFTDLQNALLHVQAAAQDKAQPRISPHKVPNVVIDITGGTKVYSAVATVVSTRPGLLFAYLSQDKAKADESRYIVNVFDVLRVSSR